MTVRAGAAATTDYALPPRPPDETPAPASPADAPLYAAPFDAAAIEAKRAETAAVSALLHDIFADGADAAETTTSADTAETTTRADHAVDPGGRTNPTGPAGSHQAEPVAGLDPPHSALLRALAERPAWPQEEFEALATRLGLLPAGALDVLNEAALDATDDPVVTGEGDLEIDTDVLQELLS